MVRCLVTCSEHVGHLNPTLPVVKALVESGHEVHFLCLEMARKKVEEAGAIFHNTVDVQSELYVGRGSENLAVFSIMEEHGLEMSFLNILKRLAENPVLPFFVASVCRPGFTSWFNGFSETPGIPSPKNFTPGPSSTWKAARNNEGLRREHRGTIERVPERCPTKEERKESYTERSERSPDPEIRTEGASTSASSWSSPALCGSWRA